MKKARNRSFVPFYTKDDEIVTGQVTGKSWNCGMMTVRKLEKGE